MRPKQTVTGEELSASTHEAAAVIGSDAEPAHLVLLMVIGLTLEAVAEAAAAACAA